MSGAREQARSAAIRLVRALLDNDIAELEELFDDTVLQAGGRQNLSRGEVVKECTKQVGRQGWNADTEVGEVLDLSRLEAGQAGDERPSTPLPQGIRPTDIVVDLVFFPAASRPFFFCLERANQPVRIFLRPGLRPTIVSF